MSLNFHDFLTDSPAAQAHRAAHPIAAKAAVPDPPRQTPERTAVAERERLIGEYVHAHPAETRANAIEAVYQANDGLYDRCRKEETFDIHGRRLSDIYARATASFGVDRFGNEVGKSALDIEADVLRRAALVLAKAARGTTVDAAIAAVFAADPALYQQYRRASYL